jgi:primosomal protein N' (replication factor Y)
MVEVKYPPIAKVALDVPLRRVFDYTINEQNLTPAAGMRVRVPFGQQTKIGVITACSDTSEVPYDKLKSILEILDITPSIPRDVLQLCAWAADYYHAPLGEVLAGALPVRLRQGEALTADTMTYYHINTVIDYVPSKRAVKQNELWHYLQTQNGATLEEIQQQGFSLAILKALQAKECVVSQMVSVEKTLLEYANILRYPGHALNAEQQQAVDTVVAAINTFKPFVLDGITGSGKTEVYLQVIAQVLHQQKQVLVLVPEIGLTPQMIARFTERFSIPIVVMHSKLTEKERLQNWLAAKEEKIGIVIGTRSSIWAAMPNLGLIIVDEAHDVSYKQQEGVRYSARDVAVQRAYQKQIPIILGSATHSLETLYNAQQQRFHLLSLTQRAGDAKLGQFKLIDIRNEKLQEGISTQLLKEIALRVEKGEQALLFLNRRGFSPILICHQCAWVAPCPHCDSYMTLHLYPEKLHCHHCNTTRTKPKRCVNCQGDVLMPVGLGTERIEQTLKKVFPKIEIARIDKDTTRKKGSMETYLQDIQETRYPILIGTQMLAKGHHFPNVTLVGIIDADSGLFSSEFRATEHLAQLLIQVAGRAGREEKIGEICIQTRQPQHPLFTILLQQGYHAIVNYLLEHRQQAHLPPYAYMAIIRIQGRNANLLQNTLQQAKTRVAKELLQTVHCLGPAPSPMAKRDKLYHYQLLLWSHRRAVLHQALTQVITFLSSDKQARTVRWSIDVDPYDTF